MCTGYVLIKFPVFINRTFAVNYYQLISIQELEIHFCKLSAIELGYHCCPQLNFCLVKMFVGLESKVLVWSSLPEFNLHHRQFGQRLLNCESEFDS